MLLVGTLHHGYEILRHSVKVKGLLLRLYLDIRALNGEVPHVVLYYLPALWSNVLDVLLLNHLHQV
jgi:hypothetical protein